MKDNKALQNMTPNEALQKLMDGNLRFCTNNRINRDILNEVSITANAQYPFAIVLGCIDSRVPIEILFDQGVGDLFVARVAGNFENNDIIASMEYACKVVGSKLILVLGHEGCGAVKAAYDDVKMGHITALVSRIKTAISKTKFIDVISDDNKEYLDKVAKTNVGLTIQRIKAKSSILNKLEREGTIKIIGAYYSVQSGKVQLL